MSQPDKLHQAYAGFSSEDQLAFWKAVSYLLSWSGHSDVNPLVDHDKIGRKKIQALYDKYKAPYDVLT